MQKVAAIDLDRHWRLIRPRSLAHALGFLSMPPAPATSIH